VKKTAWKGGAGLSSLSVVKRAEQRAELYLGAVLKSRFLELEKRGWVTVNREMLALIKD
jgi:hypothetical protein